MSPRWEPDPDVRRGRSVVYNLHAHLVFTPKYRHGVFNDAMLDRCEQIMRKVCEDSSAEPREFNGEHDHLHLLVHYPPKVALSVLVNSLKGVSARRLRAEFTGRVNRASMHGRFWSPSYFVGSCGGAPLSMVKDYIDQQKHPGDGDPGMSRRST